MAKYKFSDRIKTAEGKKGIVQEDQEAGSTDVKVLLEGEEVLHIYQENDLTPDLDDE